MKDVLPLIFKNFTKSELTRISSVCKYLNEFIKNNYNILKNCGYCGKIIYKKNSIKPYMIYYCDKKCSQKIFEDNQSLFQKLKSRRCITPHIDDNRSCRCFRCCGDTIYTTIREVLNENNKESL